MSGFARPQWLIPAALALAVGVWVASRGSDRVVVLGPADGHDLPPTDLERVGVGDEAPDFSLRALSGELVTLSEFRGSHDVVLVFYRGHW